MWARLLINESINSDPANITYINTLKNLNPDSAKLLKMVWQSAKDKGYDYFEAVIDNHTQDATWSELDLGKNETMAQRKDAMQISFSSSGKMNNVFFQNNMKILIHLKNQGLIDIITTIGETLTGQDNSFSVWAIISPYGYDFVSTCETIKENEGQNENQ
ncbi:MAG: hypothetical protein IPH06_06985 [Alphaproteobacteria bacterium]|nr:hypothetical protein [Alphaproteobacteria bacterium]